jgi:hypothetical protein
MAMTRPGSAACPGSAARTTDGGGEDECRRRHDLDRLRILDRRRVLVQRRGRRVEEDGKGEPAMGRETRCPGQADARGEAYSWGRRQDAMLGEEARSQWISPFPALVAHDSIQGGGGAVGIKGIVGGGGGGGRRIATGKKIGREGLRADVGGGDGSQQEGSRVGHTGRAPERRDFRSRDFISFTSLGSYIPFLKMNKLANYKPIKVHQLIFLPPTFFPTTRPPPSSFRPPPLPPPPPTLAGGSPPPCDPALPNPARLAAPAAGHDPPSVRPLQVGGALLASAASRTIVVGPPTPPTSPF